MEKEKYTSSELEVIGFGSADVITESTDETQIQ